MASSSFLATLIWRSQAVFLARRPAVRSTATRSSSTSPLALTAASLALAEASCGSISLESMRPSRSRSRRCSSSARRRSVSVAKERAPGSTGICSRISRRSSTTDRAVALGVEMPRRMSPNIAPKLSPPASSYSGSGGAQDRPPVVARPRDDDDDDGRRRRCCRSHLENFSLSFTSSYAAETRRNCSAASGDELTSGCVRSAACR
mmetsp:Transcript_10039/g.32234  ORF Transcript_10039/g.32234 Transcript_10039/m.32234 type:complete len:205 (-) Transcript_10039:226-840(-)